jgi:hypothetical protein
MTRPMTARTATSPASANRPVNGPIGAILVLALVAGLLLVVAEFSTVASVKVEGESCKVLYDTRPELADRCSLSGWERHGGALILLGLVAAGAGFLSRRPGGTATAGAALVAVGAVTLGLALIGDLPVTNETGAIGLDFDGATGSAGLGFYLELIGGALALLAGALALTSARREPAPAQSAL